MRRSLCRLQLHAVFCEVSVLQAPVQGCSSRTAGNRRSFVEAGGGKDLAEQGLVAINIGGAGEGKTKETGTEGSGGREGEQGGPTGSGKVGNSSVSRKWVEQAREPIRCRGHVWPMDGAVNYRSRLWRRRQARRVQLHLGIVSHRMGRRELPRQCASRSMGGTKHTAGEGWLKGGVGTDVAQERDFAGEIKGNDKDRRRQRNGRLQRRAMPTTETQKQRCSARG